MSDPSKCPIIHGAITSPNAGRTNQDWWPEQLNLSILHQHDKKSCPMDDDFEYRKVIYQKRNDGTLKVQWGCLDFKN